MKILELNESHFITGITLGSQFQRGGLFWKADGINPLFEIFSQQGDAAGVLRAGSAATDITGAVVVDTIGSMASGVAKLGMLGSGGNFYSIPLTTPDAAPTNLRSGANVITNPAIGMGVYKGNMLYAQLGQIGAWNMSNDAYPTGWTDNAYTGLQTTYSDHQMHTFKDRIYVVNAGYIAMLPDATSGAITNMIDFSSEYRAKCLSDDGQFLVIGISQATGNANTIMNKAKICFWDTTDPNSWQREWELPEPDIISILRDDISMIAICPRGVYRFAYDMQPKKIMPMVLAGTSTNVYPYIGTSWMNIVCWAGADISIANDKVVYAYGSPTPDFPPVLIKPVMGLTGNITTIKGDAIYSRLYIATDTPKLYRVNLGGTAATSVSAQTIFLNLGAKFNIQKITITFAKALASGDSLNLDVASDYNATATDWGTYSFATHGAVQEVSITNSFKAKLLSLIFNFNGGNPGIRRIEVFGTKDTDY